MTYAHKQNIEGTNTSSVRYGMLEGADVRLLAADVRRTGGVRMHIASDDVRVQNMTQLLAFFAPDIRVIILPAWDCLPYDRVSPSAEVTTARLSAFSALLDVTEQEPTIVLTTLAAATQWVMSPDTLRARRMTLTVGDTVDVETLTSLLVHDGYRRADTVREAGEFARRGGIIDIFPPHTDAPIRLDCFGSTIDQMKSFDAATQLTQASLPHIVLLPAAEYGLDPQSVQRFRSRYRDLAGIPKADDVLYSGISEGRRVNGAEHWLPFFHENLATVFDYIQADASISLDPQIDQTLTERWGQIKDYFQARQAFAEGRKAGDGMIYYPLPPEQLYVSQEKWHDLLSTHDVERWEYFKSPDDQAPMAAERARDFTDVRANKKADLWHEVRTTLAGLKNGHRRVVLACYSDGSRDRLKHLLEQAGAQDLTICNDIQAVQGMPLGRTGLIILPLDHGWISNDLAVLTEQDILGDRLIRRKTRRAKTDAFIQDITTLQPGDLVVHQDHGIGRFESLETIRAAGAAHDCLKLIYAGGDRLFLPVENMELLTRFGGDDATADLDKLGGASWQARKARVKKNLLEMAEGLLAVAAARALQAADVFTPETGGYDEFLARFPYQETDDQLSAIQDVLHDLMKGSPTDRLVCGDVGFGKTEVAMRAAYVVAASGAQVAVVVPTTLLARQHTRNFLERFKGLGIQVGQISRLVSAAERSRVKQGLRDGSIQIVVGTHAVLGKDVHFANLGLMVVDEEQRFGVKQKEALKNLKHNVHVLTLTATPIPRTLQMALTGVREMSIMATPPVDRLAIRTVVMPFDPLMIREAIMRERHRGGQTFYVCPRIADLADVAEKLRDLVPEIRVVMAHGQLAPTDLEDRMSAFYDGQYDVLLATNIIESGIDIPTANTMIVHRADMFGLAQLYQIRGRIGRSKARAHAYLTYDPHMKLNATAQKRLEVIETLDTLGAGFQLASHDLDIRGAGNLLGDDQSGHIREVGVELYQQMLEEAVQEARARGSQVTIDVQPADDFTPAINLGMSVLIPETYVTDLTVRLTLYRRLSSVTDRAELDALAAEMVDRFGVMPAEGQNLLDLIELKILCRAAGVDRVDAGPQGAVMGFYQDRPPAPEALMAWIAAQKGTVKVRPDQRLHIPRTWPDAAARVAGVRGVLEQLVAL